MKLKRVFLYKETELSEVSESMTEKEHLEFYSNQFPELINATVGDVKFNEKEGKAIYEFKTTLGTKG